MHAFTDYRIDNKENMQQKKNPSQRNQDKKIKINEKENAQKMKDKNV